MTTFEKTATTLGYLATPLPSSEMFTAVQTGVVDGAIGAALRCTMATYPDLINTISRSTITLSAGGCISILTSGTV